MVVGYVWGHGMTAPAYYTFLSDVLDHTPDMAITCVHDLLTRIPIEGADSYESWADVGNNFRAARFWGWWLDGLVKDRGITTYANYFPDLHGKEKIDGHIGRSGRLLQEAAKRRVINTHAKMQSVLLCKQGRTNTIGNIGGVQLAITFCFRLPR